MSPPHFIRANPALLKASSLCLLFLMLATRPAAAHDPLEISATVYLRTNCIEVRAVMMRKTILLAADHQGVPLLDFSIPAEREEALPMLRSLAPGLFTLTCGTNLLRVSETNIILGAEDHIGFNLTFSATNAPVKLDAKLLAHLPAQDPYGVNVVVLDMANNKVVEQKLLNTQNASLKIALPQTTSTNPPASPTKTISTPLLP